MSLYEMSLEDRMGSCDGKITSVLPMVIVFLIYLSTFIVTFVS